MKFTLSLTTDIQNFRSGMYFKAWKPSPHQIAFSHYEQRTKKSKQISQWAYSKIMSWTIENESSNSWDTQMPYVLRFPVSRLWRFIKYKPSPIWTPQLWGHYGGHDSDIFWSIKFSLKVGFNSSFEKSWPFDFLRDFLIM